MNSDRVDGVHQGDSNRGNDVQVFQPASDDPTYESCDRFTDPPSHLHHGLGSEKHCVFEIEKKTA